MKHQNHLKGNGNAKSSSKGRNKKSTYSNEAPEEVVQADFAFFDPKPDDFHGVKILLQNYLDNKQWDLTGFVDLILSQTTVGTVVKIEDDEDDGIFALVTALNLGRYKDHKSIMELKDYLLKLCQEGTFAAELKAFLEDQPENVGLLVSQRMMNLPLQLLPHLYDALLDEISWAVEDEPTEELRKSFCFKHFLVITRIYKKNAPNRSGYTNSKEEDIIYIKPDDEIFHELSLWSFTFPLRNQRLAVYELRNYQLMGLVMAVEAEKAPTFRQQLHSLINES
ncbi:hypothetical protein Nepgr_029496 [Nepenthes gracilis]|uniref:Protein BCCIP homolog n=1 Tax=Nepenthes gracilis TaxID=150966 RepID=A0AAD3TED2_NEPGR|nr:hypothetical protein Nepgr_029496 [Nepenthes gracilis]